MSNTTTSFVIVIAATLLLWDAQRPTLAGSATWSSSPSSGDWNTAANWVPNTVPNGTSDVATFGASNVTDLSSENTTINLDSAVFNSGAPPYTLTLDVSALVLNGAGIINNSGFVQSFVIPEEGFLHGDVLFYNTASAGNMATYSTVGGFISFNDTSSAGSAMFDLASGDLQAFMSFFNASTAAGATVNASASALVSVFDEATAGNAQFNLTTGAFLVFSGNAMADQAIGNCIGGSQFAESNITFQDFASADEGIFTAIGVSSSDEMSAYIEFDGSATAANATFVIGGGLGAGLAATTLTFFNTATAGAASITANGGVGGSDGGAIIFANKSRGGTASITLSGNAELDISTHSAPGITIGSLSGSGSVLLGARLLTIGSDNQSTTFSGVIQDSGGLTKTGTGTLTVTGANTYTGNTTVSAGMLVVSNRNGSGTGAGSVNVQAGTLGGKGIISGPVTVGTGSGVGAFLAPGIASNQPAILTCNNTLSFKADSTYTYKLSTRNARADQVIANGVTIESGAQFDFHAVGNKRLTAGTVFTAINNASPNPISGTFANLPDNSTFTVGRNNYQANYEGGDGNDLTLTVVP